jgi:hypothetical protein
MVLKRSLNDIHRGTPHWGPLVACRGSRFGLSVAGRPPSGVPVMAMWSITNFAGFKCIPCIDRGSKGDILVETRLLLPHLLTMHWIVIKGWLRIRLENGRPLQTRRTVLFRALCSVVVTTPSRGPNPSPRGSSALVRSPSAPLFFFLTRMYEMAFHKYEVFYSIFSIFFFFRLVFCSVWLGACGAFVLLPGPLLAFAPHLGYFSVRFGLGPFSPFPVLVVPWRGFLSCVSVKGSCVAIYALPLSPSGSHWAGGAFMCDLVLRLLTPLTW